MLFNDIPVWQKEFDLRNLFEIMDNLKNINGNIQYTVVAIVYVGLEPRRFSSHMLQLSMRVTNAFVICVLTTKEIIKNYVLSNRWNWKHSSWNDIAH